jgi:beta-glucosidase
MASIGVNAYRFSIAWPRVQPTGRGRAEQRGLDHYRRLAEGLRSRGIRPLATLYHWDLPQPLEDAGGWPARATAERFGDFADIAAGTLGDLVDMWITVNEPMVAAWLGYGTGAHAPGRSDEAAAWAATHHLLLAHGIATDAIRATTSADVGIALNLYPCRPASASQADADACRRADLQWNRLYLDPVFRRGYPPELLRWWQERVDLGFIADGDLDRIAVPLDFLGVNYYTRNTVAATAEDARATELPPSLGVAVLPADGASTAMGWPVEPEGLTEVLMRLHVDYGAERLLITENGAAFPDRVDDAGRVRDPDRVEYLRAHVEAARRAVEAGVPLGGYFVWSFLDNFEWAAGYSKRFGLVHVDFATQRRILKDSGRWYARLVAGPGAG